jgi:hypothetical protein
VGIHITYFHNTIKHLIAPPIFEITRALGNISTIQGAMGRR